VDTVVVIRVVAGTVGGRQLQVPRGPRATIRPTSELVRASICNSLTSLGALEGASVADLFAGSGALGIEALSRGARSAVFVESDRQAIAAIRANLATLAFTDRATVVAGDALRWAATSGPVDVAFIDPPYVFAEWEPLLSCLDATLAACESDRPIEPPEGWTTRKVRHHGGTLVSLLERRGAAPK
jgi:16S rRNA (guanine966-N2)-methyltransferase